MSQENRFGIHATFDILEYRATKGFYTSLSDPVAEKAMSLKDEVMRARRQWPNVASMVWYDLSLQCGLAPHWRP